MCLPVVFLHKGNQKYLSIAIHRALESGNDVYLLGDKTNQHFCSHWIDLNSLHSENIVAFRNAYVHMSSHPEEFELLCILRYFYLYEFMQQENLHGLILMDSDCLVYKKYNSDDYFSYDCAFGWDFESKPDYICPSSCYWTPDALYNFITYCLDLYTNHLDVLEEKWSSYQKKQGGICDLTLLHLWFLSKPPVRILNLSNYNDILFEFVPAHDHDPKHLYQYNNFTKLLKIKFIDNHPNFVCHDNTLQPVNNLHMHGGKKIYMHLYDKYKENGIEFYILECYRRLKWYMVKFLYSIKKRKS